MISDSDKQIARIRSKRDQLMERYKKDIPDLERISNCGPNTTEEDVLLCRIMAHTILGEIKLQEAEVENASDN